MKTSLHPIAFSKTMSIKHKVIGLKTNKNTHNVGFAQRIISKYSSLEEYNFDFDSFIYVGGNIEKSENIVRASRQVIELLLSMNHFFFHASLDMDRKAYLDTLGNQVSFYLNELNIWRGNHFNFLQTLYSNMQMYFLQEPNKTSTQNYNRLLYEAKLEVEKGNKLTKNKIKTYQHYSISAPFYHMMSQIIDSRKSLNYKEIWKLSVKTKERIQTEIQKHQYINHWNNLDEQEKELICNTFDRYKILNYLPEQIVTMQEKEWLRFIEKIREITKEQSLQTIDNNMEQIQPEFLHILNVKSSDEFMDKVTLISKHKEQIKSLNKEQWIAFYNKILDYNAKISTLSVLEDFHKKVSEFNLEYKESIQFQTEEVRILSLKNEFLESLESIVTEKQVQGFFSFLQEDLNLTEHTKELEVDLVNQIESLKEIISYLDFNVWKLFLDKTALFEQENHKVEENKIETYKAYFLEFLNSTKTLEDVSIKQLMEKYDYDLQINEKSQFLKVLETYEYPKELLELIHLSLESTSIKEAAELYSKFEESYQTKLVNENNKLYQLEVIKRFIHSLETHQWEVLLNEIRKYANIVHIVEKQEKQSEDIEEIINNTKFFDLINEEEQLNKLSKLIQILTKDSSIKQVSQLYKSMEKSLETEIIYKNNIWHEKEKIKEFIGSLKTEQWEILYGEIRKYQSAVKILEENEIKTDGINRKINRNRFIELMNETKKGEELVELIHMSIEKSPIQEVSQLYKNMEKSFEIKIDHGENIWYKKQIIKEFIGNLETEQWETLYGKIKKYQDAISIIEKNERDNIEKKINSNRFIEVMDEIERPDELVELIHTLIEKSSLKEIAELYKNVEKNITAKVVHENIGYYKKKVKEFIGNLKTEEWEILFGEISKYQKAIHILEKSEMQLNNTYQKIDSRKFMEVIDKIERPDEWMELIHMSVEKSSLKEVVQLYKSMEKNLQTEEQEKNIWHKKQKIKEFIGSLNYEQWETLYGEVSKHQEVIRIIEKNKQYNTNQKIDSKKFIEVIDEIERTDELLELIHTSAEKNSLKEAVQLYKDMEKSFKIEEEENIWNKKQKIKEFIGSLNYEQWETLYGEISKHQEAIHIIEKIKQYNTNQKIDSKKFIELIDEIERPDEWVELIHTSAEKNSLKEAVQLYKDMEKSFKIEEKENIWNKKQKIKEFISSLNYEQWETLYTEISKYQKAIRILEKNEMQVNYTNQYIASNKFIEVVDEIEKSDELIELIHRSIEKSSLKDMKELYNKMEYDSKEETLKKQNMQIKKQRLKEFIHILESEQWIEIQHQLNKYSSVVKLFENQNMYEKYPPARNHIISNTYGIKKWNNTSNIVYLLNSLSYFSAEQNSENKFTDVKEALNLTYIITDFFKRIDAVNTQYKDKILSQTEETRLLSYKTHFLDSIQNIGKLEELQLMYHLFSEDEQLKIQAKIFGLMITDDVNFIHNESSFIEQKNNLEEFISYMDLELWEKFYERIKVYHKNQKNEKYKSGVNIAQTPQYNKRNLLFYEKIRINDIIESLNQLIEQPRNSIVNKTLYLSNQISNYKKNISSFINLEMLNHKNSAENKQFEPEYEIVHMVTTSPIHSNKKVSSDIVPDITHEIKANIKETVDDIENIVRKDNKLNSNTEFAKQLENVTKTMEVYKKEMEQIKLSQSKILKSASSNQIAKKVLNQLQGQLRIERMRRGLE